VTDHRAPAVRDLSLAMAVLAPLVALALVLTTPATPAPRAPAVAEPEPVPRSTVACPPVRVARGARVDVVGGSASGGVDELPVRTARATVLRGAGEAARGTFAARVDRDDRSLSVLRCDQPAARWWFAGAGGDLDHASVLHLANVDDGPAVVDVRLHGAAQSVDVSGTQGLTLAPGESVRLALADVAPGSPELTIEVAASRGRVTAAVADSVGSGREWLPPGPPPSRSVVVPGGAAGGRPTLLVTNPGDAQAVAEVEALGPNGAFVPVGVEPVPVGPGAVASLALPPALDRAVALRLTSEVPLVAALRGMQRGDHAVAAGSAPLPVGDPAVLVTAGRRSAVRVAAGTGGAVLEVVERSGGGAVLSRDEVTLEPGGSLEVVPRPRTATVTLVASEGEVHAAAVHSGPGIAVQPAPPVPWTVVRPAVRQPTS
jgi:hypothetical protein